MLDAAPYVVLGPVGGALLPTGSDLAAAAVDTASDIASGVWDTAVAIAEAVRGSVSLDGTTVVIDVPKFDPCPEIDFELSLSDLGLDPTLKFPIVAGAAGIGIVDVDGVLSIVVNLDPGVGFRLTDCDFGPAQIRINPLTLSTSVSGQLSVTGESMVSLGGDLGVSGDLFGVIAWPDVGSSAAAQDGHYWTNQYGNRARLLGGAVVGSVRDASAVIYNPGALALVENPELLLAGDLFEYSSVTVSDAVGEQGDLTSTGFRFRPSLFAGEFRLGFLGDDQRLAYSSLTRVDGRFRIGSRAGVTGDDVFDIPVLELFTNDIRVNMAVDKYWAGITWAGKVGSRVGIGVSQFFLVARAHVGHPPMLHQPALHLGISFDYDWAVDRG